MPKRKQPKLLTERSLESLGEMMKKLILIVSKDMSKVDEVVSCVSGIMLSLPQSVGEVVSKEFLDVILQTFCPSTPIYIMTNRKNRILDSLVGASLHPKMRYLDVCRNSQFLGRGVWRALPNLKHLEHLSVGLAISYDVPHPVHFSKQLVELTCHYECTKQMIEEIAETCSGLLKLDIKNSSRVRDECLDTLLKLTNLHILKVEKTGLSADGCARLLYKLPNLTRFDSDYCLIKLQTLAKANPELKDHPTLKLSEVYIPWRTENLAPLRSMHNLTKLSILSSNYERSGLPEVIEILGKNLRSLDLDFMDNICVVTVIEGCPNLKQLSFKRCTFRWRAQLVISPFLPHFKNVEELTMDCNCSFFKYPFLHYTNLRYLMCSGVSNLSDVELILAVNCGWLQLAHTVRFQNCGNLSIHAFHSLVTKCDKLAVVGDLRHWGGIRPDEGQSIIEDFKELNLDLTVLLGDRSDPFLETTRSYN